MKLMLVMTYANTSKDSSNIAPQSLINNVASRLQENIINLHWPKTEVLSILLILQPP